MTKSSQNPNEGKKHLITLISTKGKSPEQAAQEAFQNYQKYEQVAAQVKSQPPASSQKNTDKQSGKNEAL